MRGMFHVARVGSSDLHLYQTLWTSCETGSSHSSLSSHSHCSKIFMLIMVGAKQPITSNVFAMSETSTRIVMTSTEGHSATIRWKQSDVTSHDDRVTRIPLSQKKSSPLQGRLELLLQADGLINSVSSSESIVHVEGTLHNLDHFRKLHGKLDGVLTMDMFAVKLEAETPNVTRVMR